MADRCTICHAQDPEPGHVTRCFDIAANRNLVTDRGDEECIPQATTADLFAHLRTRGLNNSQAATCAVAVIDLGWRPVIGDAARTWASPARTAHHDTGHHGEGA